MIKKNVIARSEATWQSRRRLKFGRDCFTSFAMTLFILSIFLSGCSQKYLEINNHKIKVEIADTDAKRTQGLSGRKSLCSDCGMLFIFEKPGNYSFWMKDMNFPLDFVFINGNTIVDLKQNISPDTYPDIITSNKDYDKVLEVNTNFISANKIEIGQSTVIK